MCINVPTSNHNSAKVITLNFSVVYYHVPTSNHNPLPIPPYRSKVVYYHVPTSNHNYVLYEKACSSVVYYHVPTSNHNLLPRWKSTPRLYIIMFLHQTTTTTVLEQMKMGCILSCSYIKPQQLLHNTMLLLVVYYHVPTSNHNCASYSEVSWELYIIMFLHQTTTVLARNRILVVLYIIMFLHQTTTGWQAKTGYWTLYIIMFLHQTTTISWRQPPSVCCILSCSYIKPQLLSGT